jgi:signal transduction histidine kinase
LEAAQRLVEATLLEARQAITSLRTGAATWEDCVRSFETFSDEFGQHHDLDVRFLAGRPTGAVPADLHLVLLRIAYEACSNAVRHGGATRIDVTLTSLHSGLQLRIHDDGRGFDPQAVVGGPGIGLRSLDERTRGRGGTLAIQSAPGHGTTVVAELPVHRKRGGAYG